MNSQEQPSWIRSLIKSNSNNEQLEFWRFVNIAYICSKSGMPESEMIKFKNIVTDNNTSYLVFVQDNRTKLYQDLEKNPKAELCWFFPLTREKYRIKSKIIRISKKDFADNKPEAKFFLEELKKVWDSLDKEEKKGFAELKPGTKTEEKLSKAHDDINDYNNPDKIEISENFALIFVDAFEGICFLLNQ